MNPYEFVPLGKPSSRQPRPGHLLATHGGVIHARLTTLGPFLIAKQTDSQNTIRPVGDGKIIPGSSIKGMLRSMAEMVGGGCISLSGSLYRRGKFEYHGASNPMGFEPCNDIDKLCITCRMFGALLGGESWKGMIEPGEGHWDGSGMPPTIPYNVIVGQPKPEHSAFYTKDGKVRGRKAYYHHPSKLTTSASAQHAHYGSRQTMSVRALKPNQTYRFSVRHQGLEPDAYSLLLYSLFLEPDLAHKLGWGKPMGFGSVRIEVEAIEEFDLRARYRGGTNATTRYEGADATALVMRLTQPLSQNNGEVRDALHDLFRYSGPQEGEDVVEWAYPKYDWFKSNPLVSLDEFNEQSEQTTGKV